jgi:hypothetical protein
MWATVQTIAAGSEVIDDCPDCLTDRTSFDMLILTNDAVITAGMLVECEGECTPYFQCAYCGRYVASDAVEIWNHIVEKHGKRAGD